MHFKGSGSMKMNDEEIQKYTEAISKNSDNLFVCPRCEAHTDKLKANIKTHLKRKNPCMHSSSSLVVHHNVQVTNDHSTHTSNHDHSVHNTHTITINNANITIQLQPINCSNPEWEDLVNNRRMQSRTAVSSESMPWTPLWRCSVSASGPGTWWCTGSQTRQLSATQLLWSVWSKPGLTVLGPTGGHHQFLSPSQLSHALAGQVLAAGQCWWSIPAVRPSTRHMHCPGSSGGRVFP